MRKVIVLLLVVLFVAEVSAQDRKNRFRYKKKYQYEEVDLENIMRRYFLKETSHPLEGVYSVSCVITRKGKSLLSGKEKDRIVERKDNYARVAIMKDLPGTKRDFVEISLSFKDDKVYPIVGDLNSLAEGKGYIYHHTEPDGTLIHFSMINESPELLEGEYSVIEKRKTITYKLSYLKIYPKNQEVVININNE